MAAVRQATGVLGPVLVITVLLNIICHNSMNLYGSVLSLVPPYRYVPPAVAAGCAGADAVFLPWCWLSARLGGGGRILSKLSSR